jgi:uncharacterized membrane protein YidH (DUF202 family)
MIEDVARLKKPGVSTITKGRGIRTSLGLGVLGFSMNKLQHGTSSLSNNNKAMRNGFKYCG